MHTEYIQSVRYKLQKRIRRQKVTGFEAYILVLKQLWQFLDGESSLVALQTELANRCPNADSVAEVIAKETLRNADRKGLIASALANEAEWAAVSMGVLRRFADFGNSRTTDTWILPQESNAFDDHISAFTELYLIPFYEYLDERLDDPQFILGRLIRFQHLCEWFWRDDLLQLSEQAEKRLARRLYEFLYTEGVEIHIEPSSVSGKADMVSSQQGADRLVADAKIFNPDKSQSKSYILQGFRQIYQYTLDYNSAMGYLVIFNTSSKQLRFAVSGSAAPLPHVVLNHKTIFFLTIDLYSHEQPASKRAQQDFVQITESEILGIATQAAEA